MRCLLAVLVLAAAVGPASAQKTKELHALLQSLDADKGLITVLPARAKEPRTFSLLKRDLPVTHALGHALKLESLRPGQRILVRLDEDDEFVTSLRLDEDCLWGYILRLDADKNELAVKLGYILRTMVVTPEVRLVREEEAIRVQDLHVGQGLVVTFTPDHRRILQVRAGKGITGTNPYTAVGIGGGLLVDVDHARRRLQLITLAERYEKQELTYDEWAYARLVYSSIVLRDADIHRLVAPCRVSYHYDKDNRRITALDIDVPKLVRRKVEKFDRAARKLTLLLDDDQKEELTVAADAKVMGVEPANLEAIREGMSITAGLGIDGKEVIFLLVVDK